MYAQGVEVPYDYSGSVPDSFKIIDLPSCKMLIFQNQFVNINVYLKELILSATIVSDSLNILPRTSLIS